MLNWKEMRKKTPVFPKEEAGKLNELGLDLQLEFSKFLEEARAHANQDPAFSIQQQQQQQQQQNTTEKPKMIMKETKSKKTWKESVSFFFFMFKFNEKKKKKNKTTSGSEKEKEEEEAAPSKTKSLKGTMSKLSGPLFGNINGSLAHLHQRIRISTSGPVISSCFAPTMAEESEVPYRYLGHPNLGAQAFGPIYLVT